MYVCIYVSIYVYIITLYTYAAKKKTTAVQSKSLHQMMTLGSSIVSEPKHQYH